MGLQLRNEGLNIHTIVFFGFRAVLQEISDVLPETLELLIYLTSEMIIDEAFWENLL